MKRWGMWEGLICDQVGQVGEANLRRGGTSGSG